MYYDGTGYNEGSLNKDKGKLSIMSVFHVETFSKNVTGAAPLWLRCYSSLGNKSAGSKQLYFFQMKVCDQ